MGDVSKGYPDKQFLLSCLATINAEHPFFASSYMPPPKLRKPTENRDLPGYAELFAGLPNPTLRQLKKRNLKTHNKIFRKSN